MDAHLGDLLPLAVGIAVSPVPIIVTILMLLGPRARQASITFGVGWVRGVVVVTAVTSVLARAVTPRTSPGRRDLMGVHQRREASGCWCATAYR